MLFLTTGGPHTASLEQCGVPWDIVRPEGVDALRFRRLRFGVRVVRLLRKSRPTVVIAWLPGSIRLIPIIKTLVGATTVAAIRGEMGRRTGGRLRTAWRRYGVQKADYVTINSPALEAEAVVWGASKASIRVLPNGVDVPPPVPGVPIQPPTALVIANLNPIKNIPLVIRALTLVKSPVSVRVCGEGDPAPLLDQARRLGVSDRIRFVDSPADIPKEIAASQFGIHPSLSEGLPNAVLELMAHGRPVVGTRVGGIPSLIDDGTNGLIVDPDDPQALAEAIDRMASSPEDRVMMGRAARERAAEFDWESSIRGYLGLLHEILEEQAPRRHDIRR
jgi:glycosyltransferase involved in cell wall biosynthesis